MRKNQVRLSEITLRRIPLADRLAALNIIAEVGNKERLFEFADIIVNWIFDTLHACQSLSTAAPELGYELDTAWEEAIKGYDVLMKQTYDEERQDKEDAEEDDEEEEEEEDDETADEDDSPADLQRIHAIIDALLRCDTIQRDLKRNRELFTKEEKEFLDSEIDKLKQRQL
jgi:hypothetical protein